MKQYPCFKKHNITGNIVYFISNNKGICLKSGKRKYDLKEEYFSPCKKVKIN